MTTLQEKYASQLPQRGLAQCLAHDIASARHHDSGVIHLGEGLEIRCYEGNSLSPTLRAMLVNLASELVNVYSARDLNLMPPTLEYGKVTEALNRVEPKAPTIEAIREHLDYQENNAGVSHVNPVGLRNLLQDGLTVKTVG